MSLSAEDVLALQTNALDLLAFFLVAPEIIGEKRFDSLIGVLESQSERYIIWLFSKGLWIYAVSLAVLNLLVSIPFFYFGWNTMPLSKGATWVGSALGCAILVPMLLRLGIAMFREHVPPGSPRERLLMFGTVVFVVSRLLGIMHALGMRWAT